MNKKLLYALWGLFYILCTVLGFAYQPEGARKVFLVAMALVFFVPGGILAYRARQEQDRKTLKTLRRISLCSLGLTLAALVGNFLCVLASEAIGKVMYVVLVLVSTPMACSQYWFLSLFLWACLLMVSLETKKKR